jgi:predicted nucleic acid-binding protein
LRLDGTRLRIYLDACCLSRLTDDQSQARVRGEAEALLSFANEIVVPDVAEADRARQLEEQGISPFDALHLASAEQGGADVFLTTDDDLVRRARRNPGRFHIRVENPVSWYENVRS